jgi:phosphoribosylamine--glycine ligase
MLATTGDAAVAIVLAAGGYPEAPRRGDEISGLEEAAATGATVFHAGTIRGADGQYRTNGGRVLSVVGLGTTIASARANAERAAGMISWQGMQRRHDIAATLPATANSKSRAAWPAPVAPEDWDKGGAS